MYLKVLPPTAIDKYISGYYALNVPDEEGIPADWHPHKYWYTDNEGEEVPLFNLNHLFGTDGILHKRVPYFACKQYEKVYIASHVRAIADLAVTLPDIRQLLFCVHDWLRTDEQERTLYGMLRQLDDENIKDFLRQEFTALHLRGAK